MTPVMMVRVWRDSSECGLDDLFVKKKQAACRGCGACANMKRIIRDCTGVPVRSAGHCYFTVIQDFAL